ncbi:MAG: hypothetical protein ABI462_14935 [Ignavibacteria bacterium]
MKKSKSHEKQIYGKYLFAGILLAAIILIIISLNDGNEIEINDRQKVVHVWSAETDSTFVKDCYNKYKPQVKDDLIKQETMKLFCRCMLEKVKSQYDENDLQKIKDSEIKIWDKDCRDKILNSNYLK